MGKCSALTRPYEKLPIPTDFAIVHITLLVVNANHQSSANTAISTLSLGGGGGVLGRWLCGVGVRV